MPSDIRYNVGNAVSGPIKAFNNGPGTPSADGVVLCDENGNCIKPGSLYYRVTGPTLKHAIKKGPGILRRLIFGTFKGGVVSIYDSHNGTTNPVSVISQPTTRSPWEYGVVFVNGLTVVISDTKGKDMDVTVVYE